MGGPPAIEPNKGTVYRNYIHPPGLPTPGQAKLYKPDPIPKCAAKNDSPLKHLLASGQLKFIKTAADCLALATRA